MNDTTPATETSAATTWRTKLRLPLMLAGVIIVVGFGLYFFLLRGRYESTNDAYVSAARVSVSTNVAGRVVEVNVHDNQRVQKGEALFRLDERPFQVAVDEAQASLGNARLQIEAMKALYKQKLSELRSAQDTLAFEGRESARQKRLLTSGISSQAQADRAAHAQDSAAQAAAAARQQIASVVANLGGDPEIDPGKHPSVQQAQAALDRAKLNLSYTVITAPNDGIVTQVEKLQVGDYVNEATPVFALIATRNMWIEANFKESQLALLREGQTATVDIDTYGDKTFKAHIASISPGTGSQFSVLPPQNATGNWVKIVQRLPVRLEIEDADPSHPLYIGLSATVTIDTESKAPAPAAVAATSH